MKNNEWILINSRGQRSKKQFSKEEAGEKAKKIKNKKYIC